MQKTNDATSPYEFYGKIPIGKAVLYGLVSDLPLQRCLVCCRILLFHRMWDLLH